MARLIFIILFLPLFGKGAYTDSVYLVEPVEVSGTVSVNVENPVTSVSATVLNFPLFQNVSGTIQAAQSGIWNISSVLNPITVSGTQFKLVNEQLVGTDNALVVNSVIHGKSSAGGGAYVDVKVNPSGALVADVTGSSVTVSNPVSQVTILNPTLAVTQATTPWITSGSVTVNNPVTSVSVNNIVPTSATGITPISGSVNVLNQITGFATSALQSTGNASLASIDSKLTAPLITSGTVTVNNLFALESTQLNNNSLLTDIASSTNLTRAEVENIDTKFNVVLDTRASEATLSAINNKIPTPTQRTPNYISTSAAGTVAAGAKSVSFHNAGFLNATVLGTVLSAGDVITFEAPDQDTLAAIAYVATGTTLRILEVR